MTLAVDPHRWREHRVDRLATEQILARGGLAERPAAGGGGEFAVGEHDGESKLTASPS